MFFCYLMIYVLISFLIISFLVVKDLIEQPDTLGSLIGCIIFMPLFLLLLIYDSTKDYIENNSCKLDKLVDNYFKWLRK